MKVIYTFFLFVLLIIFSVNQYGQVNCFLEDFEPKYATIPSYIDAEKTTEDPSVTVIINGSDTLGKVSKYILGNALAVWTGNIYNDPVLSDYIQKFSPTLIRYPGGSWSDIFFWDGNAKDIPSLVWDGSNNKWATLTPQFGKNSWPTSLDNYYLLRENVETEGLITINYAYARYSTSDNPVAQAAHYAADWVRYDAGRTKFWEIGNENDGPWEAGWKIDTTLNKDGQPEIISGELYGKHFKIFADSMRAAASEIGATIYIGAQIVHEERSNYWNVPDRKWNEGLLKEIGNPDSVGADFYVFHNYFGNSTTSIKAQIDAARSAINSNINFVRQDLTNKNALQKPVALTEWNCGGPDLAKTSIANGMQAITLFCEMIKNNFGMSARWLLVNWESDGMFYKGNDSSIPAWNPRPDFYFIYYLQQFIGDHVLNTSVNGSSDILAYSTKFYSGHLGIIVVNKGTTDKVVKLQPDYTGIGEKYYIYSLTGIDNSQWPQAVKVNDAGPTGAAWGPLDGLENIPANAYQIDNEIKINSPAYSVEYVLIEPGDHFVNVNDKKQINVVDFKLEQNYPNPFNPSTTIKYSIPSIGTRRGVFVQLKIYDILGNEVITLVNEEKPAGKYEVIWNAKNFACGVYFYKLSAGEYFETKKMLLLE
jgi:hypothetical protein